MTTTRRPSHYTHGRQVICVPCAEEVMAQGIAVPALRARYFAGRQMLCGHCHAQIGPWSADEIEPGELQRAMALYLQADPGDPQHVDVDQLLAAAKAEADG